MRTKSNGFSAIAVAAVLALAASPAPAFDANTAPNLAVWLKADAGAQIAVERRMAPFEAQGRPGDRRA